MYYKTLSLKLLSPTRQKRAILDDAISRYSVGFEVLLRMLRERSMDGIIGKAGFLKLMDKNMMAQLKGYDVEPFKDALKLDCAMMLTAYAGRRETGRKAAYPSTRTDDADINDRLYELKGHKEIRFLYDKYEKTRPLLFCRYDAGRDYSILLDQDTGRYYGKLYLFNLKNAVTSEQTLCGNFRYLCSDRKMDREKKKRRYVLFPLDLGDYQRMQLQDTEKNGDAPKSAALLYKNGEYYLNIRLAFQEGRKKSASYYLGVVRGINQELCYAVCDSAGKEKKYGVISGDGMGKINRLHKLANDIVRIAGECRCKIIMANMTGKTDRLTLPGMDTMLTLGDYNQVLKLTEYKAAARGLSRILVSPVSVFYQCPRCGEFRRKNRMGEDTFLCVSCGYSGKLERIGANNMAKMLLRYQQSKVRVMKYPDGAQVQYVCKPLRLTYTCPNNRFSDQLFCDYVKRLEWPEGMTKTQRSIMMKIGHLDHVMDAFEFHF